MPVSLTRAVPLCALFLSSTLLVHAASQPRITAPVDNSVRVRLNRSHLSINPASDLGAIDGARPFNRMFLVLNMAPEQQHELATLLDSQQTKGSPSYHRWLTPDEYAQRFGPAPEDLARIVAWLQQQGFSAIQPARSGMWIEFSGTVATVNRAFQTRIHAYQLGAETHIANSTDISIPSALSPLISGVPLHDFFSRPAFVRSPDRPAITNSAGAHAITPGDFATIYDLAPLYKANLTGAGQSIAIIARSDINLSDVTQFQKIFGLPSNVPQVIDNGIPPGVVPLGDGPEATLDTEWSAAVAPGAKIILVPSWDTATTDGVQLSASYIVDQNLAQIVNVSFTNCEQNLGTAGNAFWNNLWQQAAAQGMSVFVASGDSGASACAGTGLTGRLDDFAVEVNGLSSTPFNTSVGGTEFDETVNGGTPTTYWSSTNGPNLASAIGYIPEMVWNDIVSTGFVIVLGTGGGVSTIYPTPAWQTLNVTGLNVLATYSLPGQTGVSPRGIPDVSLSASPVNDPYLFCFTSPFTPNLPDCQLQNGTFSPNTFQNAGGGTSFSSPTFAGLMAIINQKVKNDDPLASPDGRQGLANYVLYPLAAAEDFSSCNSSTRTDPATPAPSGCVFNDITLGNNNDPDVKGYSATVGYDLASGLGSVDANKLVMNWNSAAAGFHGSETILTTSAPTPINHGQSATFDASVQKLVGDASAQVPSGAISLIAQGGTLPASVGLTALPLLGSASPVSTGNFSVSNLPGGNYNLVANFPGDGFFAASSSNPIAVSVKPESSTTTLFGATTQTYGSFINEFSAVVAGASGQGSPSGQVTLTDNGTQFAQINLDNQGVASFINCPFGGGILTPSPSPLPCFMPGTHVITATYGGDNSFLPSPTPPAASQTLTVTITKGVPFVELSSNAGPNAPNTINETFTLTAALLGVSPAAIIPSGTVQFFDGTTSLGQAPVVTVQGYQQASVQTTLSQGKHNISASYSGDMLYAPQSVTQEFDNGVPIGWAATNTTQTINPGQTATYNLTLSTATGFTGQVPLICVAGTDPFNPGTPPPGVQCTVNPTSVTFTSTATSFPVTATITTTSVSRLTPSPFGALPFAFAGVIAMGFRRKKSATMLCLLVIMALAVSGVTSCGGSSGPTGPVGPPPVNATFTVWSSYPGHTPGETVYNAVVLTLNINQ